MFENDQHATGSCRPDVVLVPFSLFLRWALWLNRHLHHKDLNWGSNCCNIDTERQQTVIIIYILYYVLLIYQYLFYFNCLQLQYLHTL